MPVVDNLTDDFDDLERSPVTDSYLYLSEHGGDDTFADMTTSAHNDTMLLLELADKIDKKPISKLRDSFQRIAAQKPIPVPHSVPEPIIEHQGNKHDVNTAPTLSHSTPLPLRYTNHNRNVTKARMTSGKNADADADADALFKMYEPMVSEELKHYIEDLLKGRSSKHLPGLDESEEEGNEDDARQHVSPDTTPPNSQDHIDKVPGSIIFEDGGSVSDSGAGSGSESSFEASYIPNSVKIKSLEADDTAAIKSFQSKHSEYQKEINQLRKKLERLTKEKNEQVGQLKKENFNLKVERNDLEVKVLKYENKQKYDDIMGPEISDKLSEEQTKEENKFNDLQANCEVLQKENDKLRLKLCNSKNNNTELKNELEYLRGVHQKDLDNEKLLTKDKVSPMFQSHYVRYKLDDIDKLSRVELSNLVKNIMLTLMTGKLETLPKSLQKTASIMKISSFFMDKVHGIVYDDKNSLGNVPSTYIRSPHRDDDLGKLENCLMAMIRKVEDLNK